MSNYDPKVVVQYRDAMIAVAQRRGMTPREARKFADDVAAEQVTLNSALVQRRREEAAVRRKNKYVRG